MASRGSHAGAARDDRRRRAVGRTLARLGVLVVCVAAAGWYVLRATSWSEIEEVLAGITPTMVAAVVGLALVNLVSYWWVLAASVPRLGTLRSAGVHLPATALSNTLPAGGALGTAYTVQRLRSWRFSKVTISSALVVNGVLNMGAKLSVALVALLALTPAGDGDLRTIALVAATTCTLLAATVALLRSERVLRMVGGGLDAALRRVRRTFSGLPPFNFTTAAARFQTNTQALIRHRGALLVVATVFSHASNFALFLVCIRAVGMHSGEVSTLEVLVAFGLSRIITVVALTPGSIGLVEVSLSATFAAMGAPAQEAVAGVILYRAATYVLPTLAGLAVLAGHALIRRRQPHTDSLADRRLVPMTRTSP